MALCVCRTSNCVRRPRHRNFGFTLIEMLLVVAILSLLISILLPTMKHGLNRTSASKCESNIRTLLIAYQNYAKENGRKLVGSNTSNAHDWLRSSSNTATSITDGMLWPYVRAMDVYVCPNQIYPTYLNSYSINGRLNGEQVASGSSSGTTTYKRHWTANIRDAEQMVFIEEDDGRGWNINSFMLGTAQGTYVDWVAANHFSGDNLGFLDGHVEYWEWQTAHLRKRDKPNPPAPSDPGSVDWDRLNPVFRAWPVNF